MLKRAALKTLYVATAFAGTALVASSVWAAQINGAIDIGGEVTVASTNSLDFVDFVNNGSVIVVAGDLDTFINPGDSVVLTDIDFTTPGEIWSVGGFTFTASSFNNVMANLQGGKDFSATGVLAGQGFDPTPGLFQFSSQTSGILASFSSSTSAEAEVPVPATLALVSAGLIVLGAAARRRSKA